MGNRPRALIAALAVFIAWVLPATVSQASDAAEQNDVLERVSAWAHTIHSDEYGGIWREGGLLVVGVTRNANNHRATLASAFPDGEAVIRSVARSLTELRDIVDKLPEDSTLAAAGARISAAGVDLDGNRVLLSLTKVTPQIQRLVAQRYGPDAVKLEELAYPRLTHRMPLTPPWPGGMHLFGVCNSSSSDCALANCTGNFITWNTISGVRFQYMFTGGHCFVPQTEVLAHNAVPIGPIVQSFWHNGTDADVARISPRGPNNRPYIYVGDVTQAPVSSLRTTQSTSDTVCKSGISTGETCQWDVTTVHTTINVCQDYPTCSNIVQLLDQVRAIRSSAGIWFGDSGGPVYSYESDSTVRAHGIVVAQDSTQTSMWYTFLPNALSKTGTSLCTTTSC